MQHQLFIRPFVLQGTQIIISDPELIGQSIRVLRAKPGYECMIQNIQHRYHIRYIQISKHQIQAEILQTWNCASQTTSSPTCIIIGIPNKVSKIELIVQKIVEIGINQIILVPMARSVLSQISDHKLHRIDSILLEACEQSRSWNIPSLTIQPRSQIRADHTPDDTVYCHTQQTDSVMKSTNHIRTMIIGPEGGFDPKEIQELQNRGYSSYSFPTGVLRTETASICGAYQLRCRSTSL